jgi:hypothetical protein
VDTRIRIVTILGAVGVLLLVLELVRRRKLKEEYSVLWVATAFVLLVLASWYGALDALRQLIGGSQASSTLFFFGLVFVIVVLLHFSVRISSLERRITALVQEIALMSVQEPDPELAEREPRALEEPRELRVPEPSEARRGAGAARR